MIVEKSKHDDAVCDRNICRHCKCPDSAHDVSQTDFVDVCHRLGIEPSHDVDRDEAFKLGYSWVPPGLSARQVVLTSRSRCRINHQWCSTAKCLLGMASMQHDPVMGDPGAGPLVGGAGNAPLKWSEKHTNLHLLKEFSSC